MNLAELLDMHRSHYIDHFVQSLAKWSGGRSEVLLEMDRYVPDPIYKLFRGDYVREIKGEIKLTSFKLSGPFQHAVYRESRCGMMVVVQPFEWNECTVQVLCERFDRQALEAWATYWMDTEDEKPYDADGVQQVIHYFSPPTYPEGKLTFAVDLGTAPVRAVLELLRIFEVEKGTLKVTIGADF